MKEKIRNAVRDFCQKNGFEVVEENDNEYDENSFETKCVSGDKKIKFRMSGFDEEDYKNAMDNLRRLKKVLELLENGDVWMYELMVDNKTINFRTSILVDKKLFGELMNYVFWIEGFIGD